MQITLAACPRNQLRQLVVSASISYVLEQIQSRFWTYFPASRSYRSRLSLSYILIIAVDLSSSMEAAGEQRLIAHVPVPMFFNSLVNF